jgi:hypothetical protein
VASAFQSIEGWFDFDDIYELALRRCGSKAARFVEVGAYKGRSACYMAERIRETRLDVRFDVVDTFAGDQSVGYADLWPEFAGNLQRADLLERITVHRRPSVEAAESFEDQSVDFVFIDADHSFEAVSHDLAAWWPKLKPGSLMAGHDYTHSPSVKAAVDGFVAAHGLSHAFRTTRASWMIYRSIKIDAAYCINLARRPDRRREAEAQFQAAGIAPNVAFFEATEGRGLAHPGAVSDGQAGCCMSHLNVLRAARAQGYRHVLVFEDDIRLANDFRRQFEISLARCPVSYDLCFVGALCYAGWGNYLRPFDDRLSRIGSVFGLHAHIVNMERQPDIEAGLGALQNVIDNWYASDVQPRGDCYGFDPWLAFQANGFSDIAGSENSNAFFAGYVWR